MLKQSHSGKGGSPKKQIKRLRRKAVATLRQARLTAQLELVSAEAESARIREAALAAAADETAAIRADAHAEAGRILEQGRADATAAGSAVAVEQRSAAEAEARAVLAEAEPKAARVVREAEIEARSRRDQIVADAMQEAVTIRSSANEEVTGFLRRLDDERSHLLEAAGEEAAQVVADARAASATDAARLRDSAEQEMERKAAGVIEQATAEGRQIVERAEAEAKAKREEAEAIAAAAKVAAESVPAPTPEPPKASTPTPAPPTPPFPSTVTAREAPTSARPAAAVTGTVVSASVTEVRWRAEPTPSG